LLLGYVEKKVSTIVFSHLRKYSSRGHTANLKT
jgi:hypothetical protein